jgi:hypothetical protein
MAKRQFERPLPGSAYSKAQRDAWGAAQDAARAAGVVPPNATPTKRQSRAKTLVAQQASSCFDSLSYRDGTVTAVFAKDGSEYEYDMSLADAREWFADASLGGFFNSEIR